MCPTRSVGRSVGLPGRRRLTFAHHAGSYSYGPSDRPVYRDKSLLICVRRQTSDAPYQTTHADSKLPCTYPYYYLSHSYNIQHGTDYKIGLRLCVCVCVCLSICEHSHGRISWSIFTKIGTDVRTPKSKN